MTGVDYNSEIFTTVNIEIRCHVCSNQSHTSAFCSFVSSGVVKEVMTLCSVDWTAMDPNKSFQETLQILQLSTPLTLLSIEKKNTH